MMEEPPLILCMENAAGEEVSLSIQPHDNFQTFLLKANALLGYEVDLNSVTRNQPVALTDNIYQFLMSAENNMLEYPQLGQTFDQMLEPNNDDLVYVLDDGTQIKASQIHFDNEDQPIDFTAEKIPFIKYIDDGIDDVDEPKDVNTKMINIVESPVSKWSSHSSPKKGFANSLPFRPVCNNTSGFEAQFTKYLETSNKTFTPLNTVTARNKSPRSLIKDNYKKYDDNAYNKTNNYTLTRDEVLNMFKDPPVTLPYESHQFNDKRRHVRKTDPSRPVHKPWNAKPMPYVDVDGTLIGQNESQNCFICEKFVDNNMEKLYLFDNEDQRLHRSSPPKKLSTQLKIICDHCLNENFKPSRMKSPNKNLDPDEYLVIRNNQQYIFQKTNSIDFKNIKAGFVNIGEASAIIDKIESKMSKTSAKQLDFVKLEIGSDGEIITKNPDVIKDEKDSSDVEIIEAGPEIDDVIDNLEEADEEVKEFLGMYQRDSNACTELKCRFCERVFADLAELMEHADVHRHLLEDGEVYPCPLCNYGYADCKWLKGHLKAAHDYTTKKEEIDDTGKKETGATSPAASPVAKRTRSNMKSEREQKDEASKAEDIKPSEISESTNGTMVIKTEVKQEALDTSDEEAIWIVHTADDESANQLQTLLQGSERKEESLFKAPQKCDSCSQIMIDASAHKCRKRGRKRKCLNKDETVICVPTQEDFLKRAQGRPRQATDDSNNSLLVERNRKKKTSELTSDPQIVTCHNCNESFTSKVRLKFHMQFHETTPMRTPSGQFACTECAGEQFATETELFDHLHFRHHKQRRWQCPVRSCGKTFLLRATLTKHSRTHTDTRRYVCGTCGKRFLDKQTLDEHGVTHLQIKPFQCHICLKQLTRRSRLRMHLRAHEEALCPALVPVCAVCRRAFADVAQAQEHVTKSAECIEVLAQELKDGEGEPAAVLSPTSGLVRPRSRQPGGACAPIACEAACAGAAALLAGLPAAARRAVRVVRVEKAFRCEYCEDVFYLEEALNNHRVIHKGVKNPFTCHICKVSFATYSRCTTHKTTHGFYKRSLADAKTQDKPLNEGAGPSANGILGYGGFPVVKHFLCEDCGRSYLHWTYLQVHRRMKHANENYIYKCNHCDLTFPNSWSVAYHRKKVHGKAGLDEANGATKAAKDDYRIPCRDCEEVLPNKTALYKHRKKEHSDLSLKINSVHVCHVCSKRYLSRAGLEAHTRTHTARAACSHCGDSFAHAQKLHQHLKDVHGHELDFHCDVCSLRCPTRAALAAHMLAHAAQRPHAGPAAERALPCDGCGQAFRRSTAMRNQRLIQTGVRAFACARCPKRFRGRSDLNTHRRRKHPAGLAVIEVCAAPPRPRCPKRFRGRSDLNTHRRRKHPAGLAVIEVCAAPPRPRCPKRFRGRSDLNTHRRRKHPAGLAVIEVCAAPPRPRCPKRFRGRSDLNTHRRRKHPAGLAVIEVEGLNPGPEQVIECLTANNIPHENVVEITKLSFAKGTSSVVPDSARALALTAAPRAPVAWGRPALHAAAWGSPEPARRGRGGARQPRRPAILQRGSYSADTQHEELTEINVQLLLRDSTLDRQGALPLEDSLLLE